MPSWWACKLVCQYVTLEHFPRMHFRVNTMSWEYKLNYNWYTIFVDSIAEGVVGNKERNFPFLFHLAFIQYNFDVHPLNPSSNSTCFDF